MILVNAKQIISASESVVQRSLLDEILEHIFVQKSEGLSLGDGRHVVQAEPEAEVLEFPKTINNSMKRRENHSSHISRTFPSSPHVNRAPYSSNLSSISDESLKKSLRKYSYMESHSKREALVLSPGGSWVDLNGFRDASL